MRFNLQYFADEEVAETVTTSEAEGANEQTVAESDVTEGNVNETSEESPVSEAVDKNAIYAQARRRAEAEVKAKYDKMIQARFGEYQNAKTGQLITSVEDYCNAYDVQKQTELENRVTAQGVDLNDIRKLIDMNPDMQKAKALIAEQEDRAKADAFQRDVAELAKLDPSIKVGSTPLETLKSIPNEVIQFSMNSGYSLTDAYKVINYGKMTSQKADALRQEAINQAKGKEHMKPVNGVAVDDGMVEIPANELKTWRKFYPDLSDAELKKKYNNVL